MTKPLRPNHPQNQGKSLNVSFEGTECFVPGPNGILSGNLGDDSVLLHHEGTQGDLINEIALLSGRRTVNGSPRTVLAGVVMLDPSIVSPDVNPDRMLDLLVPSTEKHGNFSGVNVRRSTIRGVARAIDYAKNEYLVSAGRHFPDQGPSFVFGNNMTFLHGFRYETATPSPQKSQHRERYAVLESFLRIFSAINSRVGLIETDDGKLYESRQRKFSIRPGPIEGLPLLDELRDMGPNIRLRSPDSINPPKTLSEELDIPIEKPKYHMADIGGNRLHREEIAQMILCFKKPKLAEKWGVTPPKGLLLDGPPGTGKSMLAEAIASELSAGVVYIQSTDIYDKWLGNSQKNIKEIFTAISDYTDRKLVVIFDEIDTIIRTGGHSTVDSVAGLFKDEMAKLANPNVFIVGITNQAEEIDPALIRPGRMDRRLYIGIPDDDDRRDIIAKLIIKGIPELKDEFSAFYDILSDDFINFDEIVEATKGLSGADIAECITRARTRKFMLEAQSGIEPPKISTDDLLRAINNFNTEGRNL